MIPHKTYIPHKLWFYLFSFFSSQSKLQSWYFHGLIFRPVLCSALCFSVSILIWTLIECFPVHFKYFYLLKNPKTIWHCYSNFSTPAIFSEEMEPMFVIHNISIATDDDIIQFGDDVKIYPVYLTKPITILGNCLNWEEKTIVSDHLFLSISCKLIWELTNGHWVYVHIQLHISHCQ